MTQHEEAAIEFIDQKVQELDTIHKEALNALNAVLGKDRLLAWKKQVVGLVSEKINQDHGQQLSKDWLETSYFVGDLFDELADDVEMCRRHLKKLSKDIQANGLPDHTSSEIHPTESNAS